ncbi:MAG: YgaP family membrane protein [Chitinophagaceae bacterium]|jgi:hypothetical protein
MKKNMGGLDKAIRLVVAVVLAVLYFTNTITGTFALVAVVAAAIFTLTSIISFCPLYTLLGINTCKVK